MKERDDSKDIMERASVVLGVVKDEIERAVAVTPVQHRQVEQMGENIRRLLFLMGEYIRDRKNNP